MLKSIAFFLLLFSLSFEALAVDPPHIDCSDPANIDRCAPLEMTEHANDYERLDSILRDKLLEKMSEEYVDEYRDLDDKWLQLLIDQCAHMVKFYGFGTLGRTNKHTVLRFRL